MKRTFIKLGRSLVTLVVLTTVFLASSPAEDLVLQQGWRTFPIRQALLWERARVGFRCRMHNLPTPIARYSQAMCDARTDCVSDRFCRQPRYRGVDCGGPVPYGAWTGVVVDPQYEQDRNLWKWVDSLSQLEDEMLVEIEEDDWSKVCVIINFFYFYDIKPFVLRLTEPPVPSSILIRGRECPPDDGTEGVTNPDMEDIDACLELLSKFRNIKKLTLLSPEGLTERGYRAILKMKDLEWLNIRFDYLNKDEVRTVLNGLSLLSEHNTLKTLVLWNNGYEWDISEIFPQAFPPLRRIERLGIFCCRQLPPEAFRTLSYCGELRVLDTFAESDDSAVEHLVSLQRLEVLSIPCIHLTDTGLANIAKLKQLKAFCGLVDKATPEGLKQLSRLPKLQHVDIGPLDDDKLVALASCRQLKCLNLCGCTGTAKGLAQLLSNLPNLELLSLRNAALDDLGMMAVGQLASLRMLDISFSKVTDIGFQALRGLPNLEHLRAENLGLTDKSAGVFLTLPRLKTAWLCGNKYGPTGEAILTKLLHRCRFYFLPSWWRPFRCFF